MKKFVCLFFIIILSCCLVGCSKPQADAKVINVEEVVINKSHAYCNKGEKIVLLAQVYPFNANNQNVIWKSDNESIAVVNSGIVEAVDEGRTVITAQSEDGNFCDECVLYVSSPKLDYSKYPNNLISAKSIQAQILDEELPDRQFFDFDAVFDQMFELQQQMSKTINDMFEQVKYQAGSIKNKQNNVQKISQRTKNISESEENLNSNENQTNAERNQTENHIGGYVYEYKFNSNGIDEDADEFTTYKDENTIIKEMSF
ncbi:MAG: Ig domain-containing protein [Christensenellales bacterium]